MVASKRVMICPPGATSSTYTALPWSDGPQSPLTEQLRVTFHTVEPSTALLRSASAVASLWAAHQGEGGPGSVAIDQAESALVVRQGLDVLVVRLPAGAADFVASLQRGETLGAAASEALQATNTFELSAALTLLLRHGALTTIDLPEMP